MLCGSTAGERYLEKKYGHAPEWVNQYPGNKPHPALITAVAAFVQQLTDTHGAQFAVVSNQYDFKTYLFKSKAGNLKIADMEKSLNTPAKITALATALGMSYKTMRNKTMFFVFKQICHNFSSWDLNHNDSE